MDIYNDANTLGLDFSGMQPFGGLKVVRRDPLPELKSVNRGWKERFFSRPWHPFTYSKMVPIPENIEKNKQAYIVGGNVIMTDRMIEAVKHLQ